MNPDPLDFLIEQATSIKIFGYGSLTWKPDFQYDVKQIGYVKNFQRRFWQGNTTHRGTTRKPGRVVTVVEREGAKLWGVAYTVTDKELIKKALNYLNNRESKLGGYTTYVTEFYPRSNSSITSTCLMYTATNENDLYLGPASVDDLAIQIVFAKGEAGSNIEYVTRLAQFIRHNIPEDDDEHIFALEKRVLELMSDRNLLFSLINLVRTNLHSQSPVYLNSAG